MKLSIITVNRNDAAGLRRTLSSVVAQTIPPCEFIVIDGASTDGSVEVIREYAGSLSFWSSEPDSGIYNAMNKGISHAGGEWCLFLNSGDTLCDREVLARIEASGADADILCGNAMIQETPPRRKTPPDEVSLDFLFGGSLCHQSVLIRTRLLREHPYDEQLKIVADRKFFLQALIFDNATYRRIDVDIADYDITGYSARNRFASEQEYARVLEEMVPRRILSDYGKRKRGFLYGDRPYEKMFLEIGRRNWRGPVYRTVRRLLGAAALLRPSAAFIRSFPRSE